MSFTWNKGQKGTETGSTPPPLPPTLLSVLHFKAFFLQPRPDAQQYLFPEQELEEEQAL